MTFLRFCSVVLSRIKIDKRRFLISKQISNEEKEFTFSSFYIAHNIIYAKELLDEGKLYSDYLWYPLFSHESEDDRNFIEDIERQKKLSAKALFEKEIETKESLNQDELGMVLNFVKENFSDFYDQNFPILISDDHDFIKYLWICIKPYYMTSNSWVGFQVARHQFISGMDIEKIKLRIDEIDKQQFDNDESLIMNLFLKAYDDGFQEKRYYNLQTLEVLVRDFG